MPRCVGREAARVGVYSMQSMHQACVPCCAALCGRLTLAFACPFRSSRCLPLALCMRWARCVGPGRGHEWGHVVFGAWPRQPSPTASHSIFHLLSPSPAQGDLEKIQAELRKQTEAQQASMAAALAQVSATLASGDAAAAAAAAAADADVGDDVPTANGKAGEGSDGDD